MTPLSWVLALCAAQADAEEIARQAAALTLKDHRPAFAAVSRLADLAAGSRPAVEAAAAKLPEEAAFYREALREELRLREKLGARFPTLKRRSFDFKEQSPQAAYTQVTTQFAEKLDLSNFRRGNGGTPFSLELKDVSYMEALDEIGRKSKAGLFMNGTMLSVAPQYGSVSTFAYRNFLVLVPAASRSRLVEFGGGERRSLNIFLQVQGDSEGSLLQVGKPRLVDAVDGDGRAIGEAAPEPVEAPEPEPKGERKGTVGLYTINTWVQHELRLALPKNETLARLRGWIDIHVPGEVSSFEFADLSKPDKKSDDHFTVEISRSVEPNLVKIELRVTPRAGVEAFLKMPTECRGNWSIGGEQAFFVGGKVVDGRVDYVANFPTGGQVDGRTQDLKSLKLRIHRSPIERKIPFEFRDIDFK